MARLNMTESKFEPLVLAKVAVNSDSGRKSNLAVIRIKKGDRDMALEGFSEIGPVDAMCRAFNLDLRVLTYKSFAVAESQHAGDAVAKTEITLGNKGGTYEGVGEDVDSHVSIATAIIVSVNKLLEEHHAQVVTGK
jgi:hypothetical protein